MSLYVRLSTNFWTNRKTIRLRALIGDAALWVPQRLWCYAAENQPDGDLSNYLPEEISMLIGYSGCPKALLEALQQAGFLDGITIHGWSEHNGYHGTFSERAKKAAEVRWEEERKRKDKNRKETSIASSICPKLQTLKDRVGGWFHRRPTTIWSEKEMKALARLVNTPEDELLLLEDRYTSEIPEIAKFRRQEIQTLLNNWSGEIDRARRDAVAEPDLFTPVIDGIHSIRSQQPR